MSKHRRDLKHKFLSDGRGTKKKGEIRKNSHSWENIYKVVKQTLLRDEGSQKEDTLSVESEN